MPGNDNNTEKILAEIDTLLQNFQQTGGNGAILDEINALISEYRGAETTLSEAEVMRLAQRGGAKKRGSKGKKSKSKSKSKGQKKTASKSKSKAKKSKSKGKGKKKTASKSKAKKSKSKSKGKRKTASKSKGKRKTASKSKARKTKSKSKSKGKKKAVAKRSTASKRKTASKSKASKSKSKSRGRKMKREEGEKPKRKMNPFMANLTVLRRHIMDKLGDELKPMNVGAMSSAASVLLKANDVDAEKAKKNFNKAEFMKDYNAAKKRIEAKKAAKKAAKAAATH